ncbi:MAG: energy transducer TonB [Acidobacteria bacterium]|nr:energy transducer TonB [Acidobacteriota bacterium]
MRSLLPVAITLSLALSWTACKSAGGPKPQAPAAPLPEALKAWVGQKRILAGAGEAKSLRLEKGDPLPKGDCDVAVEVRRATFDKGTVTLAVETLGRAEVSGRARGTSCREVPTGRLLSVSGFASANDVAPALEKLLSTSEAHLAARDVAFHLPAEAKPPKVAAITAEAQGTAEERSLGRLVTSWPKLLLSVHPLYNDLSGRVHHEGEVEFDGTVGPDGRLYKPALLTSLGQAQEEHVTKALALWRYEPAKKGEERVAARIRARATLKVD